jgi:hypothetical protein
VDYDGLDHAVVVKTLYLSKLVAGAEVQGLVFETIPVM